MPVDGEADIKQLPTNIPKKRWTKEKIIIIVLSIVLVGLGLFVAWDLWGKKVSFNCPASSSSATDSSTDTSSSSSKKGGSTTTVDASLYSSCTAKIGDEKVYKSCCDTLSVDDAVKKACKKVVDDKNTTTTTTNTPRAPSSPAMAT